MTPAVLAHGEGAGASSFWSVHGGHLLLLLGWAAGYAVVWWRGQRGRPSGPVAPRDPRLWLAAAASLVSAAVHLSVIREHLEESLLYGGFFLVVTAAQVAWAVASVRRPTRSLLLAGAVASGLVALLWLATRTVGIPLGPAAGEVEAVGVPDVVASATEVVVVLAVAWALAVPTGRRTAAVGASAPTSGQAAGGGPADSMTACS